jgi:3-oxoacyl-[acyl-carrier protein] reductase
MPDTTTEIVPENPLLALVTGGSGALGSAICKRLAADGMSVLVHANRGAAAAQAVVDAIIAAGGQARAVVFDITDAAATRAAIEAITQETPIQILVNNAGIHNDAVFAGMSDAQWHSVLDVSLNGFFNVTQPLMLSMLRTRYGRIVNVSSVAAVAGNRGQVNYAAAKAALHGASKSLALEVASRGVTVNVVAPGIIESPMIEGKFDAELIKNMVPMKRAGQATEVADLVGFLTSPQASYITGQVISINGGMI